MSDRKITVVIDPLGNPTIEGHNFVGQSCAEKTKGIEEALATGTGGYERTYKDSWHETEHDAVEQQIEH